jgi:hypothetical protein
LTDSLYTRLNIAFAEQCENAQSAMAGKALVRSESQSEILSTPFGPTLSLDNNISKHRDPGENDGAIQVKGVRKLKKMTVKFGATPR